jgi:hypothetical protein
VDVPAARGVPAFRKQDPVAEVTVPADASLLVAELRDQRKRGGINFGYRLTVEPAVPDFSLELPAAELNVPRGGAVPLSVAVLRRGYTGPVRLGVRDLPPGYAVQGGLVPANAASGLLTITAPAGVPAQPFPLRVEGVAPDLAGGGRRAAVHTALLSRDPGSPVSTRTFYEGVLAQTSPAPFAISGPPADLAAHPVLDGALESGNRRQFRRRHRPAG